MVEIHLLLLFAFTSRCLGAGSRNDLFNDPRDKDECLMECPKTNEYNPMCGNNGVKYWNSGFLRCAQECGVDVHPTHPPPCTPTTTEKINVDQCIIECPKTSEYNPVCGSDGKKYNNMGYLRCAQYCGVDVTFIHFAPC